MTVAHGAGVGRKILSPFPVANASPALVVSPPHFVPLPFCENPFLPGSVFASGRGGEQRKGPLPYIWCPARIPVFVAPFQGPRFRLPILRTKCEFPAYHKLFTYAG